MPLISIISINYNNRLGLEKTLLSVIAQKGVHFEYIVVDGASTDDSCELLNQYANRISKFVSEKDSGIYNAMNKGIQMAAGEYVLFLNSGDYFYSDDALAQMISGMRGEDVVYADIVIYEKDNLKQVPSAPLIQFPDCYQHNLPPHPVFLARRSLIERASGFDESYRIIADVVLIASIFALRPTYRYVPIPLTVFDLKGVSSQKKHYQLILEERKRFISANYPQFMNDLLHHYPLGFWPRIRNFFLIGL